MNVVTSKWACLTHKYLGLALDTQLRQLRGKAGIQGERRW